MPNCLPSQTLLWVNSNGPEIKERAGLASEEALVTVVRPPEVVQTELVVESRPNACQKKIEQYERWKRVREKTGF
jgi:hypothetical protein